MKAEIAERIRLINKGQVPEGYKKSKVGIIPSDWEDYKLGKLLKLCERPIKMEDDKEYELVTVRRNYGGVDSRGLFFGKDILVKSQFLLKENDFLISKRQIAHGACGLVPKELENAIVSNEYNVFLPEDLIDIQFFNYYARLPFMKKNFYLMSDGVHIEKLLFKPQSWLKLKISIPSYKKQQKIASTLSTWDKAIELKEKLISEKKKQKTALMQELLTGKKRLDGFDEEWEEVRLGDICNVTTGKLDANAIIENGEYYFFTCAKNVYRINDYAFDTEALLISGNGANVGYIHYYKGKFNAYQRTYVLDKFNKDILFTKFLLDKYLSIRINKEKNEGNTPYITLGTITDMKIRFPLSIKEQEKIVFILSLADKEISLLEKELQALKEQKKGLMQLLLTGIVRVN